MDEIREEVCRLKREELKARLKGLPFTPTDEDTIGEDFYDCFIDSIPDAGIDL